MELMGATTKYAHALLNPCPRVESKMPMSEVLKIFCFGHSYCLEFSLKSNSHAARQNLACLHAASKNVQERACVHANRHS